MSFNLKGRSNNSSEWLWIELIGGVLTLGVMYLGLRLYRSNSFGLFNKGNLSAPPIVSIMLLGLLVSGVVISIYKYVKLMKTNTEVAQNQDDTADFTLMVQLPVARVENHPQNNEKNQYFALICEYQDPTDGTKYDFKSRYYLESEISPLPNLINVYINHHDYSKYQMNIPVVM